MNRPHDLPQNRLLTALSEAERTRSFPHLQPVALPLGKVLCEPGANLQHVYFPTDCIVSHLYVTVCKRQHSLDQQLCRWLLLSLDRLQSNELTMTEPLIASMLGVRGDDVTEATGKPQERRPIRFRRGRITILDRSMLESLCCECYAVVKKQTDRLMPTT